jgi:acetyltransferase
MVDELAGRALLDGWRGGPVLDRAALGRFVAALGDLLLAHPHLQDVESTRCGSPRAGSSRSTP